MHNSTQIDQVSGVTSYVTKTITMSRGDTLTFTYSKDGSVSKESDCGYVKIANITGAMTFGYLFGEEVYTGGQSVVQNGVTYYIPSTIEKVTITNQSSIPNGAFMNCNFIEEIVIQEGAVIGTDAFKNCNATITYNS